MQIIWSNKSTCTKLMANLYDCLIQNSHSHHGLISSTMNNARDQFRDYLFSCHNEFFPRTGPSLVDITEIINLIDVHKPEHIIHLSSCTVCGYYAQVPISMVITYIPTPSIWTSNAVRVGQSVNATCTTSETWIKLLLQHALRHIELNDLPPSWTIEINPHLQPKTIPSLKMHLRTSHSEQLYYLRAIIYTGSQHFTARLIIDDMIWNYDSAKNNGRPYLYTMTSNSEWNAEQLLHYEGRDMYQLIYGS